MNEARLVISKDARIGAENLINQMRQGNEVSQMPIVGKKSPLYIKDSLEYEKQKYLSFLRFCESRLGTLFQVFIKRRIIYMTEEQFSIFLYNCRKKALSLRFIDSMVMESLFSTYIINDNTYESVISGNTRIFKELNIGVCFTMACYIKNLLDEMGIEESYLMTSFNSAWPNTVVLYKYQNKFLICDLAEQVRKYEKITNEIGSIIVSPNSNFTYDDINEMFKFGKNINCLSKKLSEYFKDYPEITCEVIMHKDNKSMNFDDLPKIPISEFLKLDLDKRKKI